MISQPVNTTLRCYYKNGNANQNIVRLHATFANESTEQLFLNCAITRLLLDAPY